MADLGPLRDAGIDVDSLTEEQRRGLAALSDDEVATLASINKRIQDAPEGDPRRALAEDGNIVW